MTTPTQAQFEAATKKIETDLAWRGPNGKTLGHVVLAREMAEQVFVALTAAIRNLKDKPWSPVANCLR